MRAAIHPAKSQTQPATVNIRLTEQERIRVMNSEDLFAIMQKVLLRENKIDRDKELSQIITMKVYAIT
uniref:Uncharacterized protein n=1 Tax=Candidatus Kentrum sp. MB TaxID=2138164 RepID=A0A450XXT5_9GAMM|nr:MAG: hypothetical protein BECKMB1821G_GA0114241_100713 [Candidatus Kentron sp. MB]VFK34109.1 MAG: hypothetical protein BECKMB1821I_GA0114274_10618 [Candidatus Kentron sp. MB]VFK76743.1 MAG: hypothetical protein BECKMB1821H_GA0114242_10728 [Candidatus Kentron sp. MB]